MKKFIKTLIAATLLLSTLVALCVPSAAASFSDVSETHWAYENINKISEKGLMIGRATPNGVRFDPTGKVLGVEIYETLYRVASGKNAANYFDGNIYFYDSLLNMWYTDSYEWAMRNGIGYVEYTKGAGFPDISSYIASGRHGSECLPIPPEEQYVDSVEGFEKKYFSRTDVILSLYYYVTTYLGINITDNTDLSHFSDWSYEELEKNTYPNKGLNSNYILYSCSDIVYI